jgi:hypothetical protein
LNFYKPPFLVPTQSRIRDLLPENLIIYGVKGKDFNMGINHSDEIRKAMSRVAGCLINEIEKGSGLSFCMGTI